MTDDEKPQSSPSEGVRIIGAQEAAEAAGRSDVVKRQPRKKKKRFGDRPETPDDKSPLPRIRISSSDEDLARPQEPVPQDVVRPSSSRPSPRWADDEDDLEETMLIEAEESNTSLGHARIIPNDDDNDENNGEDQDLSHARIDDDVDIIDVEEAEPQRSTTGSDNFSADDVDDDALNDAENAAGDRQRGVFEEDDVFDDDDFDPDWADQFESDGAMRKSLLEDSDDYDDDVDDADDDSFVLPHWTEPPTGQVPKVVLGDADYDEPEFSGIAEPRWRDEGERVAESDFQDLADDEPLLGALGNDELAERFFDDDDDDFDPDYFDRIDSPAARDDDDILSPGPSPRRRPPNREAQTGAPSGERNLPVAIGVGVGLAAVALLCFRLGTYTSIALVAVVVVLCTIEYFTKTREVGFNPAPLVGLPAAVGLVIGAGLVGLTAYPVVLGLTVVVGLLWYVIAAPGQGAVSNMAITLLGIMWIGFLGSFAALFLGLGRQLEAHHADITSNPGIGVLIAAILASVFYDIGGYFGGKYLGQTPLPALLAAASPNKTQEGTMVGVAVSLVVTIVVVQFIGISPIGGEFGRVVIFAVLCAVVAPFGDLVQSAIKRDIGIKDMSAVLPGHGGVLDRVDSLLFVLPVAFFVTLLFDIWTVA